MSFPAPADLGVRLSLPLLLLLLLVLLWLQSTLASLRLAERYCWGLLSILTLLLAPPDVIAWYLRGIKPPEHRTATPFTMAFTQVGGEVGGEGGTDAAARQPATSHARVTPTGWLAH